MSLLKIRFPTLPSSQRSSLEMTRAISKWRGKDVIRFRFQFTQRHSKISVSKFVRRKGCLRVSNYLCWAWVYILVFTCWTLYIYIPAHRIWWVCCFKTSQVLSIHALFYCICKTFFVPMGIVSHGKFGSLSPQGKPAAKESRYPILINYKVLAGSFFKFP